MLALALPAGGCSPAPPPRALLLITIDTLRADRVGVYGGGDLTPALDHLARRGTWFTRARTVVPLTLPSHASILTGLHPASHGVHNNGTFRLGEGARTLAEILRERGWRTGAAVGSTILDAQFGLAQGFETYDAPALPAAGAADLEGPERDAARVTRAALDWLARRDGRPSFLWAHYFDPHTPYAPPEPLRSAHPGAPYDAEVAHVDREVGRLLEAAASSPDARSTLVAVVGDHGESLGEHGEATHGIFLYEAVLRVPLVLSGAGVPRRGADSHPATTLDLLPTLLRLLRIPLPAGLPGRDLLAAPAEGGGRALAPHAETRLPCLNFGWSGSEAIADGEIKLILGAAPELYDLGTDPAEREDLAARHPAERERLEALLDAARASLGPSPAAPPASEPALPDAETRSRLESLGYLAGGGEPAGGCRSGREPRSMLAILATLDRGVEAYAAGRREEAAAAFREVARLDPANRQAHYYLATALRRLGRLREAAAEYATASRLDPDNLLFAHDEAAARFDLGDAAGAEALLRRALERRPEVPRTRFFLGNLLLERGRAREALAEYDAARAGMPPSAEIEHRRGRALLDLGRRAEGIEAFASACALAPDRSDWLGTLAGLLAAEGRGAEAAGRLREFLAAHPDDPLALYNLAVLMEASGQRAEALHLYRRAADRWTGERGRLESLRGRIRRLEEAAGRGSGAPPESGRR